MEKKKDKRKNWGERLKAVPAALGGAVATQGVSSLTDPWVLETSHKVMRESGAPDRHVAERLMKEFAPKGVTQQSAWESATRTVERNRLIQRIAKIYAQKTGHQADEAKKQIASDLAAQFESMGPAYIPYAKGIINTKNASPELLAHEIGHARTHARLGRAYKGLTIGSRPAAFANPLILGAGIGGYLTHRDKDPERAKKWRNRSLALAAIPTAGLLADEIAASAQGTKMLKQIGSYKPEHGRNLRRAFGTYAVKSLTPFAVAGGVYGADALIRRHKKKKQREKVAALKHMITFHKRGANVYAGD